MRVYTSYFAMEKRIPQDFKQVSIALRTPYFFNGSETFWFQPTSEMLFDYKCDNDVDRYTEHYHRIVLGRLDVHEFWREMEEEFGDTNVVLMCYARPEKFCHRHLVAKWFTDAGYPVTELTINTKEE